MITLVIALKSPKSTVSTYTQSGTKPNLVAKILAANFGVFFCNICNVFKTMFNVGLIIM